MSAPRIYGAIGAIIADLARSGIAKNQINSGEQYAYRGLDEVCNRLSPLLAQHRVCILPRVLEHTCQDRTGSDGTLLNRVVLRIAFDFVSARDGSSHTVETYGEALDGSDKATAKAMSAAYKQAVLQAFCIPVQGCDDPDAATHRVKTAGQEVQDPIQGWEQWSKDIQDMIMSCETAEALDRIQSTYAALLRAASKREPERYVAIGSAMRDRRKAVSSERGLSSSGKKLSQGDPRAPELDHG